MSKATNAGNGRKEKKMKTGDYINSRFNGATLHEIDFTPKGTKEIITVYVWAKNRLSASNELIYKHIWGKQHAVRIHNASSLLANK